MFDQIQNGFGADGIGVGQNEMESLAKALSAGYGYAGTPGSLTGGSALMVESLEYTLHSTTWDVKHLRIWPVIAKSEVWNTVHEFQRYTSHGQQSAGAGFFDADSQVLPQETDAAFNRQIARVRYIGCTKVVTHPMTLVRTSVESAVAIEARAGTKWILEQQERQLFESHDMFLDPANGLFTGSPNSLPPSSLKYDGIGRQITFGDSDTTAQYSGFDGYGGNPSSIYDLQGSVPTEEDLEAIARVMAENFGMPTHFFMDFKTHSDLNRLFQVKERINPMGVMNGQAGFVLTQMHSSAGIYAILPSRFLTPKRAPLTSQTGAPGAPTVAVADVVIPGSVSSRLGTFTYSYVVSAINNIGEGAAGAAGQAAITATHGARLTITAADGVGVQASTHYAVYRAPAGTTANYEFIGYIFATQGVGVGAIGIDGGFKNPGLASAYLLQLDQTEIEWKQLAPLMKMNLAILSPAIRFMVLLYGMPLVYTPKHQMIARNLGRQV